MPKINIVVELENENYCNGCPFLMIFAELQRCYYFNRQINIDISDNYIRPEICKEQNKEVHNG